MKPTTMKVRTITPQKTQHLQIQLSEGNLSKVEIAERFDEELKRRYWAEKALLELLPELEKSVTSYELLLAIKSHTVVTRQQIDRLLHVFDVLEWHASGARYEIMDNLLLTARMALNAKSGFDRDEAIVTSCKRILQHEIAIYEKLLGYSKALGQSQAGEYISKSIEEEKSAHSALSEIELRAIYFA